MQKRRRFRLTATPEERLAHEAQHLREEAKELPAGAKREGLLRKASQLDTASHITEWVTSPGLRPPS